MHTIINTPLLIDSEVIVSHHVYFLYRSQGERGNRGFSGIDGQPGAVVCHRMCMAVVYALTTNTSEFHNVASVVLSIVSEVSKLFCDF